MTFTGLVNPPFEESQIVVLPVPYDHTTSYFPGARNGPRSIIIASADMETYDIEMRAELVDYVKIHTLSEIMPNIKSPKSMKNSVRSVVKQIIEKNKFPVTLGGDHSISIGVIEAFHKKYKEDFTVVQIDAHADLRDKYDNSRFSHACIMRRVKDMNLPTVQVGIRSMSSEEAEFIKQKNMQNTIFYGRILQTDIEKIVSAIKTDKVYITIDVDGFDPSIIPGTGTLEPNGLLWETTIDMLRRIFESKNVLGFDVVEVRPTGTTTQTQDNASRLIYKMLLFKFRDKIEAGKEDGMIDDTQFAEENGDQKND